MLVPQVLALSRVPSTTASAAQASAQLQPQGEGVWTPVRRFIAGYFSGCALVLAGHPVCAVLYPMLLLGPPRYASSQCSYCQFDTIKVRLQHEAGAGGRFKGVVDCVQQVRCVNQQRAGYLPWQQAAQTRLTFPCQTVRGEGLLALYKGVLPPLVMTGGINCVLFGLQVIDTHSGAVFHCGYVVGPC